MAVCYGRKSWSQPEQLGNEKTTALPSGLRIWSVGGQADTHMVAVGKTASSEKILLQECSPGRAAVGSRVCRDSLFIAPSYCLLGFPCLNIFGGLPFHSKSDSSRRFLLGFLMGKSQQGEIVVFSADLECFGLRGISVTLTRSKRKHFSDGRIYKAHLVHR